MKLNKKFLESDEDLLFYQNKMKSVLDIDFPLEYLRQSKVRVFTCSEGKIIGGYMLVQRGPFRTLNSIPNQRLVNGIEQERVMEVTGLFLDRELKAGIISVQFWLNFINDVCSCEGKDKIVYAYDLKKKGLGKLYGHTKPRVIYRGLIPKIQGMKSDAFESIEIADCQRIKLLPLLALPSFLTRTFLKRGVYIDQLFDMRALRSFKLRVW